MQARILIIEDDEAIADIISRYLKRDGVDPLCLTRGEEGLKVLEKESFDLIVLDINLPGIDGFETLNRIRQKHSSPVIILSARQEDADMILGFGGGADDYVTKPFSPSVLIARIRAHLRRQEIKEREEDEAKELSFGDYTLDFRKQVLMHHGEPVQLSPREMDLLLFLAKEPGKAFSQHEIYREVWGNGYGDLSTVTVHIRRLRKKLAEDSVTPRYIKSRYGYGYYLSVDGSEL